MARKRFGLTTIETYRPGGGADDYIAKHLVEGGDIHSGGRLLNEKLRDLAKKSSPAPGRVVVARSADVPSRLFKNTFGRGRKR
jgi:hypothetical protein